MNDTQTSQTPAGAPKSITTNESEAWAVQALAQLKAQDGILEAPKTEAPKAQGPVGAQVAQDAPKPIETSNEGATMDPGPRASKRLLEIQRRERDIQRRAQELEAREKALAEKQPKVEETQRYSPEELRLLALTDPNTLIRLLGDDGRAILQTGEVPPQLKDRSIDTRIQQGLKQIREENQRKIEELERRQLEDMKTTREREFLSGLAHDLKSPENAEKFELVQLEYGSEAPKRILDIMLADYDSQVEAGLEPTLRDPMEVAQAIEDSLLKQAQKLAIAKKLQAKASAPGEKKQEVSKPSSIVNDQQDGDMDEPNRWAAKELARLKAQEERESRQASQRQDGQVKDGVDPREQELLALIREEAMRNQ